MVTGDGTGDALSGASAIGEGDRPTARALPLGERHVVLIGMMGSGKSTLGRELSSRWSRELIDSDGELERRHGRTGAVIAEQDGIEALHALERDLLLDALGGTTPTVVTAAAATMSDPSCRRALEPAVVIWLDAPVPALVARVASGRHRRPIDLEATVSLADERRDAFTTVADLRLDALRPVPELVQQVVARFSP